jgi:hypothetical protein
MDYEREKARNQRKDLDGEEERDGGIERRGDICTVRQY